MAPAPANLTVKIARAEHHIAELARALAAFRQLNPIRLEVSTSADRTWHFLHAFGVGDVSPEVSLLAGEALYQLRSTLDHLVYDLVRANGGNATSRNEFPIFDDADAYRANAPPKLKGVGTGAQIAIEQMQPYHAAAMSTDEFQMRRAVRAHDLFVLHEFAKIDRHRFMPVVRAFFIMEPEVMRAGVAPPTRGGGKSVVLSEGAEVYRCGYPVPTDPADVTYRFRAEEVLDGEWDPLFAVTQDQGTTPAVARLAQLCGAVRLSAAALGVFL